MKRFLPAIIMIIALAVCLISCSGDNNSSEKELYNSALSSIENKDYDTAYKTLKSCKQLPEAKELLDCFYHIPITEKIDGYLTEYFYDDNNLPLQIIETDSEGRKSITTFAYNEDNVLTNSIKVNFDCTKETYEYMFDAGGEIIKIIAVDSNGNVISVRDYSYNTEGNMIKFVETDSDGNIINVGDYTYDKDGNEINCVLNDSDEETIIFTYIYDENGIETGSTIDYGNGDKQVSEKYYDELDNLAKIIEAFVSNKSETEYFYNENGNLIKQVYTEDIYTSFADYSYDENGNLIKEVGKDEEGEYSLIYTYDENGNKAKESKTYSEIGTIVTDFYYDENDTLIKSIRTYTDGSNLTFNYTYDEKGNKIKEVETSSDLPGTMVYDYSYDENGNIIKEVRTAYDGSTSVIDFSYDKNGNKIKSIFTDSDGGASVYDYSYDENGNLVKIVFQLPAFIGENLFYVTNNTYDENGNITLSRINHVMYLDNQESSYKIVYIPDNAPNTTKSTLDLLGLLQ